MKNSMSLLLLFYTILYLTHFIYGCKEGLRKVGLELLLSTKNESNAKYFSHLSKYFWKAGPQAHITFSNAGVLFDKGNRERIFEIVNRFADSPHGMGRESVRFWLKDFEDFQDSNFRKQPVDSSSEENFTNSLHFFLSMVELGGEYIDDIHWSNVSGRVTITAFRALVGLKNMTTTRLQIETVDQFRSIASEYPFYNLSTFHFIWNLVDYAKEIHANNSIDNNILVDNKHMHEILHSINCTAGSTEQMTLIELFPTSSFHHIFSDVECGMIVNAKDGGNILRPEYRRAVIKLNEFVMNEISVKIDQYIFSYKNICLKFFEFCHTNPQVYALDIIMTNPLSMDNLTFPISRHGHRKFYIGNYLGDVTVNELSHQIVGAKALHLMYVLNRNNLYIPVSEAWQKVYEKTISAYKDDLLDIAVFYL